MAQSLKLSFIVFFVAVSVAAALLVLRPWETPHPPQVDDQHPQPIIVPVLSKEPEYFLGENKKPGRVIHKDESGRAPFEIRHTPAGQVKILRTFRTDGTLFKEEATLNGKPVPVPK